MHLNHKGFEMNVTQISAYPNHKERRKSVRYSTHIESVLEQKEYSIYTTVINLSEQGVGFLSAKPFKSGDIVNIIFDGHGSLTDPIKLKIQVLSCREVDLEYYIGGIIANKTSTFNHFFQFIHSTTTHTQQ